MLGKGFQRPMELATERLVNMVGILPAWEELCPPDAGLLTWQGGTFVFDGDAQLFSHRDTGILMHASAEEVARVARESAAAQP